MGPEADFFALGGHSLLATQVASRLRSDLGVEVVVRTVFEAPTVEALARRIEGLLTTAGLEIPGGPRQPDESTAESPTAEPREGRLPLSFAQQRLWFLDQLEPGSPVYNIPAAVELAGRLDVAVLAGALTEVMHRHDALRTTFQSEGGKPVQVVAGWTGRATADLPLVDLGALPDEARGKEADRLMAAEARRPFDLRVGPLLRASLLRLSGERHLVLVTLHHIVSDGWSTGVLVRELGILYAAFLSGGPARCLLSRSSMRTSPPGSGSTLRASCWRRSWPGGAASSRACRRPWSCPRITPGLRRLARRGRSSFSRSTARVSPGSWHSPGSTTRRSS